MFAIEGEDGVAAKFAHVPDEVDCDGGRQNVAMEEFAGAAARDGAVRADESDGKPESFGDGKRERVPASGDKGDLNAGGVGAREGVKISGGDLKLGIEQGAVDVDGDEANGHEQILNE